MKKLILSLIMCSIGVIAGCGISNNASPAKAETQSNQSLTMIEGGTFGSIGGYNVDYSIVKDSATNAEYIVVGNYHGSISITPRLTTGYSMGGNRVTIPYNGK